MLRNAVRISSIWLAVNELAAGSVSAKPKTTPITRKEGDPEHADYVSQRSVPNSSTSGLALLDITAGPSFSFTGTALLGLARCGVGRGVGRGRLVRELAVWVSQHCS
jgi:hypothetical protein